MSPRPRAPRQTTLYFLGWVTGESVLHQLLGVGEPTARPISGDYIKTLQFRKVCQLGRPPLACDLELNAAFYAEQLGEASAQHCSSIAVIYKKTFCPGCFYFSISAEV